MDFFQSGLMEAKTGIVEKQWFVGYDALVMPKKCDLCMYVVYIEFVYY